MNSMNYSHLRSNLKEACDFVCEKNEPMHIKRQRGKSIVMVSMKYWEEMQETLYLMKNPANARRLIEAISDDTQNIKTSIPGIGF